MVPPSTRFCSAVITPKPVSLEEQAASITAASGATAPDHSASSAASPSSAVKPGSTQPPGWVMLSVPANPDRPNCERKLCTSAGLMSVCSATASVTPLPVTLPTTLEPSNSAFSS